MHMPHQPHLTLSETTTGAPRKDYPPKLIFAIWKHLKKQRRTDTPGLAYTAVKKFNSSAIRLALFVY